MRRRHFLWPALSWPANAIVRNILLSAKAIREKIGELTDRAQAIVDVASAENRDLTDQERAEIDAILGVGKKGAADYKPGQIDALERELERSEKLEARQAELAEARGTVTVQTGAGPQDGQAGEELPRAARIVIPPRARYRHKRLRAYTGQHAERCAFMAGHFFLATLFQHEWSQRWCNEHGVDIRFRGALTGRENDLGGFVIPDEMEQAIIDLREEYGAFRRHAYVSPMAGDTKSQPRRKSGLTAYFSDDTTAMNESEKAWDQVNLVAKKLYCLTRWSRDLDEDAIISIGDDLTSEIAQAFAYKEDLCGYSGDGSSTYGGITGLLHALQAGSIHEATAGNLAFGTLDMVDFEAIVGKLPMYAGINPAWHISKPGWAASMLRLMDAAGGNTVRELASGATQAEFLGYPVALSPVLNATLTDQASTILCYFGDLRMGCTLGNRRGMSIQLSDQRYFEYDQLAIKGTERFDIVCHGRGDATNAGPIIALKTPAA